MKIDRRALLLGLAAAGTARCGDAATGAPAQRVGGFALPGGVRMPGFEFVYECDVTLGETKEAGETFEGGIRRIIPITGGRFRGPAISGDVLPGGADWNLSRTADGSGQVEAAYYLRTDDGVLLRIENVGHGRRSGPPQADAATGETLHMYTVPSFVAPKGRYEHLNYGVFVGTLSTRRDARDAVLIRVFRVV